MPVTAVSVAQAPHNNSNSTFADYLYSFHYTEQLSFYLKDYLLTKTQNLSD